MNCIYKETEYSKAIFSKNESCFADSNVIVPDSKCDIAKIVNVCAIAHVEDSKAEDGRILVSGVVDFTVLYIGESDSTPLSSITESVPFSHVIMCDNVTIDYITQAYVNSVCPTFTMINSRKLKLKADICLSVSAFLQCRANILSDAPLAQTKKTTLSFQSARAICRKNIIVTADADIPAGKGAIDEILRKTARITDYESKTLNNKLILKGNALVSVLYLSENRIQDASVSVPFTEVVEADGLSPDCETQIKIVVSSLSVTPDTDLSGEYKMVDISLSLGVFITAYQKNEVLAVTDIYLPHGCLKKEKEFVTPTFVPTETKETEFVRETLTITSPNFPQGRVIDVSCKTGSPTFENEENTAVLLPVEVSILYLSDNGVNSHTAKIQVMHKFSQAPQSFYSDINSVSYTLSGTNQLDLRMNVDFTVQDYSQKQTEVFSFCEEVPYTIPSRSSVIISFVKSGDTLWDIAKEYNIPVSDLAKANALTEDSILTIGQKLLIPR